MKKNKTHITELFMAKADWDRCFHGVIMREDNLVRGKILVKNEKHDGYVFATANNQDDLGEKLDDMIKMILDYELHDGTRVYYTSTGFKHFQN